MIERKINQNELRDMICIIFNKNNHVFFKKKQNKKKLKDFQSLCSMNYFLMRYTMYTIKFTFFGCCTYSSKNNEVFEV